MKFLVVKNFAGDNVPLVWRDETIEPEIGEDGIWRGKWKTATSNHPDIDGVCYEADGSFYGYRDDDSS